MKKILLVLSLIFTLSILMLLVTSCGGDETTNNGSNKNDTSETEPKREEKYVYFGEYPQTLKAEDVTISEETDELGRYLGSDDCYYVKATACSDLYIFNFSNGDIIEENTEYYFKLEPIKWRVLEEKDGSYTLLCASILANMAFDSTDNNYKDSDVRVWLNESFYTLAFSDAEKDKVITTTVDNGVTSTGYDVNFYACDDTDDKVFLLSFEESTNVEYGFKSDCRSADTIKQIPISDYARASGANGNWWLRSANDYSPRIARYVYNNGISNYIYYVETERYGVVPAINVMK